MPAPPPEGERLRARAVLHVEPQHAREKPGGARGPELGPVLGLEPAGEAHMVGVVVGDDHPPHRPPAQRPRQQPPPERAHRRGVEAGVDQRPAVAVVERVGVEEARPERQRQPQPEHALGDRERRALAGRLGMGEADRLRAPVHSGREVERVERRRPLAGRSQSPATCGSVWRMWNAASAARAGSACAACRR